MKKLRLIGQNGFSQIFIMVIMLLLAVALPVTTTLVKKAQDNRSSAVYTYTSADCSNYSTKNGQYYCSTTGPRLCKDGMLGYAQQCSGSETCDKIVGCKSASTTTSTSAKYETTNCPNPGSGYGSFNAHYNTVVKDGKCYQCQARADGWFWNNVTNSNCPTLAPTPTPIRSCSATNGVAGACGAAAGTMHWSMGVGTAPATTNLITQNPLCADGSKPTVNTNADYTYTWTCGGTAGSCGGTTGSSASCKAYWLNCNDLNYWAMYPDVKNAGWRPYAHYQSSGQKEGRTWPTSGSTPFCFESTKKITCGNVDTGPNDTCGTNKAPVTPAPVVCTPNSCAANTLVGQTCNDGCGGTQNGTKTNCTPNQKTCSGNILNTCNSMGTVLTPTTCTYGCSNGACNLATAKISFKFAFAGVKPNASCISSLGNLKIEVGNSPANKYQGGLTTGFSVIAGSVDSAGNQIFKTDSIALSNDFASVNNNNYVKVKGLLHLKRRMCQEGQLTKINNDTTICNINLIRTDDYVYDFSKYAFITTDNSNFYGLLAGDVNSDGVINSIDFSYVKSRIDADSDITCGREGDLNADGVVNNLDTGLIKIALSSKDDE